MKRLFFFHHNSLVWLLLLAFAQFPSCSQYSKSDTAVLVAAESARTINIQVLADEEFRSSPNWQGLISAHFDSVSEFFDQRFQIKYKITKFEAWVSDDTSTNLYDLQKEIESIPMQSVADIVVAFSINPTRGRSVWHGELLNGVSSVFSNRLIIRFLPSEIANWKFFDFVLIHEICHLFGAWHCKDTTSIMRSFSDGPMPIRELDETTTRVIRQMRGFDFKSGVLGLTRADQLFVQDAFSADHLKGEQNPIASALLDIATRCIAEGKTDSVNLMLQYAIPHCDTSSMKNKLTLAVCLSQTGQINKAGALLLSIEADSLSDPQSLNNFAMLLLSSGNTHDAHVALQRALAIDPTYVYALCGQAEVFADERNSDSALLYIQSTLALDPTNQEAKRLLDSIRSAN